MATQKINQINYAGVTYQFVDDETQANMLVLEQKVDRLYNNSTTQINDETARAKAAEAAILATQVSKEAGKGLSTNDFTNYYKNLLDNPPIMVGATSTTDGEKGIVPKPVAGDEGKFLQGDGTWAVPHDTTYQNATITKSGLMSFTDKKKLDDMDGEDPNAMSYEIEIGDGTVTKTYSSGKIEAYTFNMDGTIDEQVTTSYGKVTRFKTTFGDGTISKEVIS